MAEKLPEDKCQQTAEPDKQKSDPPVRPARRQSVVIYLIILFLAAFLLLLMAYFMQQRNSNAIIGNLQDSLTSFQTVDELREENEQLREQLADLEDQLQQVQEQAEESSGQLESSAAQIQTLQRQLEALSLLSQAELLYYTGSPTDAASALQNLIDQDDLVQALDEAQNERLAALEDALRQGGYLESEEN